MYSSEKSFVSGFTPILILILVLSVGTIGYLSYNFGLKNGQRSGTSVPQATQAPTQNPLPTTMPAVEKTVLNISGSLQDFMKKFCVPGNPSFINLTDLPFKLDTKVVNPSPRPDGHEVICTSVDIYTNPIKNGYVVLNTQDKHVLNIYDDDSQELGHGGAPFLGYWGQKIDESNNVQINAWLEGGHGPQVLGEVAVIIRGVKKFTTKDGHSVYVNYTETAIPGSDSRLINQLKPYSTADPGLPPPDLVVSHSDDVNKTVINYFFGNEPLPSTPEGKALLQIKNVMSAISAK